MATPEFGLLCDLREANACRIIYMRLYKLENAISGPKPLSPKSDELRRIDKDDTRRLPERFGSNCAIPMEYHHHINHDTDLMVVCVDSMVELTAAIDDVSNIDVREFLRDYYYRVRGELCKNTDAQAYYLKYHTRR